MSSVSEAMARVQAAQQQVQSIQDAILHAPTLAQSNVLDVDLRNAYVDLSEARKALAIAQRAAGIANPVLGQGLLEGGSAVINYPGTPALSTAQKMERAAFAGAFGAAQLSQLDGSMNNFASPPTYSSSGLTQRFNAIQVNSPDVGSDGASGSTNPNPVANTPNPVNWSLSPPPPSSIPSQYRTNSTTYYRATGSSTDSEDDASSQRSQGAKSNSTNETDPEEESEDDDRSASSQAESSSQASQFVEEDDDDDKSTSSKSSSRTSQSEEEEDDDDDSSQSSRSRSSSHHSQSDGNSDNNSDGNSDYNYRPSRTVAEPLQRTLPPKAQPAQPVAAPAPHANAPVPLTYYNVKIGLRINLKLLSGRIVLVTITNVINSPPDAKNVTVMLDGKPYVFAVYMNPTGGGTKAWLA